MVPFTSTEWAGAKDEQELAGRQGISTPPRFSRRKVASPSRMRKRARRGRANEVAKRGMHQRRNKRVSW
jgi:hypothetical protein